jgi:hypothetical protein
MIALRDSMMLEIVEIWPGRKLQSVAITEIVLQGAHGHAFMAAR